MPASPAASIPDSILADTLERQSVGLVLSGGGAKGIAHIGVIQALEENDIPIDFITGTSMGAIVGGLYACGYTPAEMLDLIKSEGFSYWSTGKIDPRLTYYYAIPEPTPALVHVNIGEKNAPSSPMSVLPTSLINPLPMNFAFMDLFAAYTAQCGGNFDNLFVPLRTVTSNVYTKRKMVLSRGSLADAIRASMSFPLVFRPIEIDGTLVYDGGIYDNYPFNVMRTDFAPSIMIGSNVSGPDKKPKSDDIFQQLEDMIIQNNDYSLPADYGISMNVPVRMFGILDFNQADTIYAIGYKTAMAMMDSIKARVHSRTPAVTRNLRRAVFKSETPYVRFKNVDVTGGTERQNEYISYLFTRHSADTFGLARARDSYYRAITPGKLENLVLQAVPDDSTGMFDLRMKATVKKNIRLGFGGYLTSSPSSMIFMSAGYNTMSFSSIDANLNAWIGQSYLAALVNARLSLITGVPSSLTLQFAASRQKLYEDDDLFFKRNLPVSINSTESYGRLLYTAGAGRRGKIVAGVGFGHIIDRFFPNNRADFTDGNRQRVRRNLWQLRLGYEYSTLDNIYFPTAGAAYNLTAMGLTGKYTYIPGAEHLLPSERRNVTFGQVEGQFTRFFQLGSKAAVGTHLSGLYSNRPLLTSYNASVVMAPAFTPTPSSNNSFNPAFRANSFLTAGLTPVWKITSTLQARGTFHIFMPYRKILERPDGTAYHGKAFSNPAFFGETTIAMTLPFATLSAYANYMSYPARNWNFGLSLGLFVLAPKFLR